MFRNDFISVDAERVFLPAIPTNQNKVWTPKLSEIRGLLILPLGAQPPSSWVSASGVEAIADNTVTDNSRAKWLTGIGEVPAGDAVIVNLGKRERRTRQAQFSLEFEVNVYCDEHQTLLSRLNNNWRGFKFWLATRGGRFLGGSGGIYPDFVTTTQPYLRGDEAEKGFINIDWFAKGPPLATTLDLFSDSAGSEDSPTPITNVMYYADSYPSHSSVILSWTENGGVLPTTNTRAQVLVFQNGKKLEEIAEYTFNHASSPGESEIVLSSPPHFNGAYYEVIAIITS